MTGSARLAVITASAERQARERARLALDLSPLLELAQLAGLALVPLEPSAAMIAAGADAIEDLVAQCEADADRPKPKIADYVESAWRGMLAELALRTATRAR